MRNDLFTDDFKPAPYWWDAVPRPKLATSVLPAKAEIVVIGSGFTGLMAALETARRGRETVVLDAEEVGFGCSTRNGGQISTSVKPGLEKLARRFGIERALAIGEEGKNSLKWIGEFVTREGIECDFRIAGRFHGAHRPAAYERLGQWLNGEGGRLGIEAHMVSRGEQRSELGTDAYYGGIVFTEHAAVNPARLHQGMLERAIAAGVQVMPRTPATAIRPADGTLSVETANGAIEARRVIVATNGYTGALLPWLQRRVIPIGSYIIATEPIGPETMARLMPKDRITSDTRKVVYYYRASPDRRRILFGGRVSANETDPRASAPRLHAEMVRLFPELAATRISHSWSGFVAYTFDELMHLGQHQGIHYAMGYCGSGAGMAGYLGMRIGQQVLGRREGRTAFDGLGFATRPFYRGRPWFLGPMVMYYQWHDRRGMERTAEGSAPA